MRARRAVPLNFKSYISSVRQILVYSLRPGFSGLHSQYDGSGPGHGIAAGEHVGEALGHKEVVGREAAAVGGHAEGLEGIGNDVPQQTAVILPDHIVPLRTPPFPQKSRVRVICSGLSVISF